MQKKTIYDVDVRNKKIYLRTDYNVPHNEYGITDDRRIRATIPTLRYLIKEGASIVIASHMGRPKGEVKREL